MSNNPDPTRPKCLYEIINDRLKIAYVGLTVNLKQRRLGHRGDEVGRAYRLARLPDTVFNQVTGYNIRQSDYEVREREHYEYLKKKGYKMLNDPTKFGI